MSIRGGSVEEIVQNQVQNVSTVLNALKYLKLITRYAERKVFELQRLLGKVLVRKYCKPTVQKEKLIAKKAN